MSFGSSIDCFDRIRNGEGERASLAQLACGADGPALHFHQALADGKPQASASVDARMVAFGLCEFIEHAGQSIRRDADACIGDAEAEHHRIGQMLFHIERDTAPIHAP